VRQGRSTAAVLLAVLAAGCGGSSGGGSSGSGSHTLTVDAASSLTGAFTDLSAAFKRRHPGWTVTLNLAGSDQLAAQVEAGQRADVFAGASPKYPEELQAKNLLGATKNFATNTLVLVVPASNPAHITSVADLARTHAKLVIGDPTVPLGSYTQTVLANLGIAEPSLNVVSQEPDAKSVLAKVTTGAADAAFVYVTDALSAGSQVRRITLPAAAQATAVYPIGVVTGSRNAEAARWWVDLVTGPAGQAELRRLGFGAPPSS
jgi:molybdate transport system substrate-binding protein